MVTIPSSSAPAVLRSCVSFFLVITFVSLHPPVTSSLTHSSREKVSKKHDIVARIHEVVEIRPKRFSRSDTGTSSSSVTTLIPASSSQRYQPQHPCVRTSEYSLLAPMFYAKELQWGKDPCNGSYDFESYFESGFPAKIVREEEYTLPNSAWDAVQQHDSAAVYKASHSPEAHGKEGSIQDYLAKSAALVSQLLAPLASNSQTHEAAKSEAALEFQKAQFHLRKAIKIAKQNRREKDERVDSKNGGQDEVAQSKKQKRSCDMKSFIRNLIEKSNQNRPSDG
ncbi:unnamed protein product [Notodromas monacha]|uniref:Uncharacterized protein n=1 Tax=Notodromas monacha TaxID=399045 RepID=A0A7R9BJ68_9CRUS|nr:unnamed protein product [Notodromas monacha]CAG0916210.1 unnamed protein product [Notodromas monacha]